MRTLIAALAFASCAHPVEKQRIMPSSMPADYKLVLAGSTITETGFFLTLADAVTVDQALSDKELDADKRVFEAEFAQHDAESRAAQHEWCSRWCLPIGGSAGLIVGAILGFLAGMKK